MKTGNFSAIYEAEDILLEDKPLKTNRRKSVLPPPTDPKLLQILEDFHDYDFTRQVSEEERRAKLEALQEHSKALEASRAGIDAEDLVRGQEKADEEEGEEEEEIVEDAE